VFARAVDVVPESVQRLQEVVFDAFRWGMNRDVSASAIFLLRVMLARVPSNVIQPLWPAVIAELMRIFSNSQDPMLLLECLRLLDFAVLLYPSEMQNYFWIFTSDWLPRPDSPASAFAPLADRILGVGLSPQVRATGLGRPVISVRIASLLSDLQPIVDLLRGHVVAMTCSAITAPHFVDVQFITALLELDFIALGQRATANL